MKYSIKNFSPRLGIRNVVTAFMLGVALLAGAFVNADAPQTKDDAARAMAAVASKDKGAKTTNMEAIDKRPNKCFALLVGVDEYAYVDENGRGLPNLSFASADARALKETLVQIGFPEENIGVFHSYAGLKGRPNKINIMRAFAKMLEAADKDSSIFVSFSGHGFETRNKKAAFCPEDVKVDLNVEPTVVEEETAILIDDIADSLRRSPARFKMLVVDACRTTADTRNVDDNKKKRAFARADVSGLAFLQSCNSGQSSYEDSSLKQGVFTHFLIEGLSGKAARPNGGGLSFIDACSYVCRRVPVFVEDKHKDVQTPFFKELSNLVDFWIVEPEGEVIISTPGDSARLYSAPKYLEGRAAFCGENGQNIDRAKAFDLLTKANEEGNIAARALLAIIRLNGAPGVDVDVEAAFDLAQTPANMLGDPWAYMVLGDCYSQGLGVGRNEKKGKEYRRLAFEGFERWTEEKDDAVALNDLGCCYYHGYGTEKDSKKAWELLTAAVEKGSAVALGNLGRCYQEGIGCEPDVEKGVELLEKAFSRNDASAAASLAMIYHSAYGYYGDVKKDDAKALEWIRKGQEKENAASIYMLANYYEYGLCGVEKNEATALELYEEAARFNESRAITDLGLAYFCGLLGCEKSPKKAVEYLQRAANMDNVRALTALADCYRDGIGVKQSASEESRLRRRASKIQTLYTESQNR